MAGPWEWEVEGGTGRQEQVADGRQPSTSKERQKGGRRLPARRAEKAGMTCGSENRRGHHPKRRGGMWASSQPNPGMAGYSKMMMMTGMAVMAC